MRSNSKTLVTGVAASHPAQRVNSSAQPSTANKLICSTASSKLAPNEQATFGKPESGKVNSNYDHKDVDNSVAGGQRKREKKESKQNETSQVVVMNATDVSLRLPSAISASISPNCTNALPVSCSSTGSASSSTRFRADSSRGSNCFEPPYNLAETIPNELTGDHNIKTSGSPGCKFRLSVPERPPRRANLCFENNDHLNERSGKPVASTQIDAIKNSNEIYQNRYKCHDSSHYQSDHRLSALNNSLLKISKHGGSEQDLGHEFSIGAKTSCHDDDDDDYKSSAQHPNQQILSLMMLDVGLLPASNQTLQCDSKQAPIKRQYVRLQDPSEKDDIESENKAQLIDKDASEWIDLPHLSQPTDPVMSKNNEISSCYNTRPTFLSNHDAWRLQVQLPGFDDKEQQKSISLPASPRLSIRNRENRSIDREVRQHISPHNMGFNNNLSPVLQHHAHPSESLLLRQQPPQNPPERYNDSREPPSVNSSSCSSLNYYPPLLAISNRLNSVKLDELLKRTQPESSQDQSNNNTSSLPSIDKSHEITADKNIEPLTVVSDDIQDFNSENSHTMKNHLFVQNSSQSSNFSTGHVPNSRPQAAEVHLMHLHPSQANQLARNYQLR